MYRIPTPTSIGKDDNRYEYISFFRKNPKLADFLGPAIENVRKYLQELYDSILDENEYV